MKKLFKEQLLERLNEKSATYSELFVWAREIPDYISTARLETCIQHVIKEGLVLYKADYKYHLAKN